MLRRAPAFTNPAKLVNSTCASAVGILEASQRLLSQKSIDSAINGLKGEGNFSSSMIEANVKEFNSFDLPESYEQYFGPQEIQEHIRAYMSAKVGDPESFDFARERDKYAFYWCEDNFDSQLRTIRQMEKFIRKQTAAFPGFGVSVASYSSSPLTVSNGSRNVIFFAAQLFPFIDPTGNGLDLQSVSTREFLTRKRETAKQRYQHILEELRSSIGPVYTISDPLDDGSTVFTVAVNDERMGHLSALMTMISHINGAHVTRTFCESFSDRSQVYSIFVHGCSEEDLRRVGTNFGLLPKRPKHPLMTAYRDNKIGYEQVIFGHALMVFSQYFTPAVRDDDFIELQRALKGDENLTKRLTSMRANSNQELVTDDLVGRLLADNPDFLNAMFADFSKGSTEASASALMTEVNKSFPSGSLGNAIMSTCVRFLASVRRHNFFRVGRSALCYRIDPKVALSQMDLPRTPYGIYLVVGSDFRGFHVRFHDIARGGVRLIVSQSEALHIKNRRTLFQENYNLAHTQTLKNKDIPESGSKGTILVSMRCPRNIIHYKRNFMQYVDSLLDNMLESDGVRDTLKQRELLFLGPDERTAGDFPTVAAMYAKRRGFEMWKSFTTGKDPSAGGIPHDVDGMTTRSVRCCINGIYKKLELDGKNLFKAMTGGPDGDLGGNEILQGMEKIKSMCDGTASILDPNGLNRKELLRLVQEKKPLEAFDRSKLSEDAIFVLCSEKGQIKGPDGTTYTNGEDFRNKFHFHPSNTADTFIPCGGRPNAVTISNVNQFLVNAPGVTGNMMLTGHASIAREQLRFKYIVEGANLFISQDARLALERCGVILIKDSSANKGGVTSSSIEVYTGMALSDEQHAEHMCVRDSRNPPKFYSALKKDIIARVESNACMEFECIWKDSQAGKHEGLKTLISDDLSRKIVSMVEFIQASNLHEEKELFRYVIHDYTPKTLLGLVSLDDILERVPQNYLQAIFSKHIASHFIYSAGVDAGEFAFFEYMRGLIKKAHDFQG